MSTENFKMPPRIDPKVFAETVGETGDNCHFPYEGETTNKSIKPSTKTGAR